MKESYEEGLANHLGPEPYAGGGNIAGAAHLHHEPLPCQRLAQDGPGLNEGVFPDRIWDVQLMDIGAIVGQPVRGEERHKAKLIKALRDNPGGLSKKKIREIAGLNNQNAIAAIDALILDKVIEGFDSTHGGNNTKIRAYKLVDTVTT